jgi:putative serine/threonine protein kinase
LITPLIVPIKNLKEEPYASVICYPKTNQTELRKRLMELREHGIEKVEFNGETIALNLPVLGKGFAGIVITAQLNGKKVALKIRRVDANRVSLQQEAQMLAKANGLKVGPKLLRVSSNFLLMQLIDGAVLPMWLKALEIKKHLRYVLNDVLKQCWRLDSAGLDHGELSKAPKHIIVDKQQKPWIVDFESASINRKPANVTSACQFLFISGGEVSRIIAEALGESNRQEIVCSLRRYKKHRTRENFDAVLEACLLR